MIRFVCAAKKGQLGETRETCETYITRCVSMGHNRSHEHLIYNAWATIAAITTCYAKGFATIAAVISSRVPTNSLCNIWQR